MKTIFFKKYILALVAVLAFGYAANTLAQQTSQSSLYVPLIGITSVPEPLALPKGEGNVTYNYAVKNFLRELPLSDVRVVDDKCAHVRFLNGDDNNNSKLDHSETWRYACTTKLSVTTESTATVTGMANNITATHKAYATVVVGSNNPPPLVSIVNVTKVAYPLALPSEGGDITFTYRVNNPGVVPLSNITVTDDKCSVMSGKLGDINGNNLLDINEVWIYRCTTNLKKTTTNTVRVTAFANGLKAVGEATITVKVDSPGFPGVGSNVPGFPGQPIPSFPSTGVDMGFKIVVWGALLGALLALIIFFFVIRNRKMKKNKKR